MNALVGSEHATVKPAGLGARDRCASACARARARARARMAAPVCVCVPAVVRAAPLCVCARRVGNCALARAQPPP
jgi:hypothetical protein